MYSYFAQFAALIIIIGIYAVGAQPVPSFNSSSHGCENGKILTVSFNKYDQLILGTHFNKVYRRVWVITREPPSLSTSQIWDLESVEMFPKRGTWFRIVACDSKKDADSKNDLVVDCGICTGDCFLGDCKLELRKESKDKKQGQIFRLNSDNLALETAYGETIKILPAYNDSVVTGQRLLGVAPNASLPLAQFRVIGQQAYSYPVRI